MNGRVVSLFAGIGGFDLGFSLAGFEIVAHVEIDANCRKLLAAKWPNAVALDDVRTAGAHNLPPCDVVTFGFPCQDLSVAGKRAGLAGGRSGLYYEATRIINELKPAYCLFENVPGLLSSDNGRDFARVLMEMDRIGYHGSWRVLDAQWFGVAQRRRRVFGLFTRLDSGAERCAEILSIPESLRGHPAPSREAGEGFTHGVAPCIGASGRGVERAGETRGQDPVVAVPQSVAGTLSANGGGTNRPAGNCNEEDSDTKPGHLVPAYGIDEEQNAAENLMGCLKARKEGGGFEAAVAYREVAPALTGNYGKQPDNSDTNAGPMLIPEVSDQLKVRGGNHAGQDVDGRFGNLIPAVAGCITSRDAKSHNPDGSTPGHLVPVYGFGGESDASSLSGAGDLQPPVTGRHGAPGFVAHPVAIRTSQTSSNGCGIDESGTSYTMDGAQGQAVAVPVAFAQNTRDEVREMAVAGALAAEPGMKQTSYVRTAMQVRRLTPTECERLQGFPDGWTAGFADSTRYKMLGNAVCVNVAEWIARRLAKLGDLT